MKKLIAVGIVSGLLTGCAINPPLSPQEQAALDASASMQEAQIPPPPGEPLLAAKVKTQPIVTQVAQKAPATKPTPVANKPKAKPVQVAKKPKQPKIPVFAKKPKQPKEPVYAHHAKQPKQDQQLLARSRRLTNDEKALLAENGKHYTIQFIADTNAKTISQFIQQHPGLNKEARTFYGHSKGRSWYKLVYGNFTSIKAAEQAVAQLKGDVTHWKPYVRRIAKVQQEIKG